MASNDIIMRVRAEDKTSGVFDKIAGKAKGLGGVLGGAVKAGAIGGGIAIAGLGVASVKMALDFEKSFGEVETLLPDISEKAFGKLRDDVIAFSKEMGISTDEAIPALYQAISAGVPPENVMEFMETAAKAAIGGVTDLETAVDGITTIVNAYGKENITAEAASDLLFATMKGGKTTIGELSSSIGKVVPIAAAFGVSMEDVSASLQVMTLQGGSTEENITALKSTIAELGKEGTQAADTFSRLAGVSFPEFMAAGGNMNEVIGIMAAEADRLDLTMVDMFGSIEAGAGATKLAAQGGDLLATAMETASNALGGTGVAFDTMADTTSFKLNKAINTLKGTLLEVGLKILPLLTDALEKVVPWLEENLPIAMKALEDGFLAVKPVIESFIEGLGILFDALRPVFQFNVDNKPILAAALLAIGVAILVAFGPVSLPIIAIVALIALLPLLGGAFGAVEEAIVGVANDIITFFEEWGPKILMILALVFTGPLGLIYIFATGSFGIRDKVVEIFGEILTFFSGIPGEIISAIGDVAGLLLQKGIDIMTGMVKGYIQIWTSVLSFYVGIPLAIVNAMGNVGSVLFEKGKALIQGLIDGILSLPIPNPLDLIPDLTPGFDIPGIPGFAHGGVVPGPLGAPVLAKVHGGERILTPGQQRSGAISGGGNTFNITIQALDGASVMEIAPDMAAAIQTHLNNSGQAGMLLG